jgi:DNA mismatch repair protein MutS2
MNEKTLHTLEYPKVLERLANYAAFSASADLARGLRPVIDMEAAQALQARTTEARRLLSVNADVSVGGARDVRPQIELAAHSGVLTSADLLTIKSTLMAGRTLARLFETGAEGSGQQKDEMVGKHRQQYTTAQEGSGEGHTDAYPHLAEMAEKLFPPPGLIDAISRAISEGGEILDNASDKLANIRRELKIAHERLLSRMERLINDSRVSTLLQESIITQRGGRYVVPLRAECKSKMQAVVHDQSSSGATLFVEPLALVEMNNRWQEMQLAERDEERRIMAELSAQVGLHAGAIEQMIEGLAELDLALMCAKYAEDLQAVEPILVPFKKETDAHPGCTIRITQARHPLLPATEVVPVDIDLDESTFALVITGPNTGGKTVSLKAAGLLVLMAQSGLHIPAQSGSTLSLFEQVFADIGDEQSIEQSLSTFSGHIKNIIQILDRANSHSLVLLDELGAGTDPLEGAALANAILEFLVRGRIPSLVATHYADLKAFAHATPGVMNASMEFDAQTLKPTYHLVIGLPGRSNALLIAGRMGLSEEIIQAARHTLSPADLEVDDLLDEIHQQRSIARQARAGAEEDRKEAEKIRSELAERLDGLDEERIAILEKAHQQAEEELDQLRSEVMEMRRKLSQKGKPDAEIEAVRELVEELQEEVKTPVKRQRLPKKIDTPRRPLKVGDKVRLRSLKTQGVLTSLGEEEAEVQLGALRMRVPVEDLQHPKEVEAPSSPAAQPQQISTKKEKSSGDKSGQVFHASPGVELDLRGMRADEALEKLDSYIEQAYLAGLPFVRVIHGKGTGRLRQAVRQALRRTAHVTSWVVGKEGEGGDGVTVAQLTAD